MTRTGIFVDDKETVYARLLTRPKLVVFKHLPVVTDIATLANSILALEPAILALDYRLDEEVGDLPPDKTYKASAVAQHLRDKAVEAPERDFPIVLVSAEGKIRALFDPDRTAHDLFDRVLVKEQITDHADQARTELVSLAEAYEALGPKQPYDLDAFLSTTADDRTFTDLQELRTPVATAAAPHQVVGFVLKQLFDKPGLLLDADDARARLGVTSASFEVLAPVLAEASLAYTGQLSDGWPRWWTHRLDAWLTNILGSRPITLSSRERSERLGTTLSLTLEPAASPWTGGTDEKISFACASCRRGAEVRHSVSAFEGSIPRHRIARRICWDCVQTKRYAEHTPPLQVDQLDEPVAARVRTLDKPMAR